MSSDNLKQTIPPAFDAAEDGKTHVNVFTRGQTKMGRAMSNFQECNIEHPFFGRFRSLEGLWYYLKTGRNTELFRILNGYDARKQGKPRETVKYPLFTKMFKLGMVEKLAKNKELQEELVKNELPLVHYYVYQGAIQVPPRHEWQLEFWMTMRQALISTGSLDVVRNELVDYINRSQSEKATAVEEDE